jgi:hypothetical protein
MVFIYGCVFFKLNLQACFFLVFPRHLDELVVSLLAIELFGKVTLSSSCLWACFHPLSPLSVVAYRQCKEILLNLSIKC